MVASLIGYKVVTSVAATSYSVSLSGLTGGTDELSTLQAGDFVFVMTGFAAIANGNPGITAFTGGTPVNTEFADYYMGSSHDTNLSLNFFQCGATPPTAMTVTSSSVNRGAITIVAAFRGMWYPTISNRLGGQLPEPYLNHYEYTGTGTTGTSIMYNTDTQENIYITGAFCSTSPSISTATWNWKGATPNLGTGAISGTDKSAGAGLAWGLGEASPIGTAYTVGSWTCNYAGGTGSTWINFIANFATGGGVRRMTSTAGAYANKPLKIWNGSAWVTSPVKRWTGTYWEMTKV